MINIPAAYTELLEYLAEKATPEEILAFRPSEHAQERAIELLESSSERMLSLEENIELEQMRYFDGLVSMLKAKALRQLSHP
jgi:hypothetical protein